MTSTAYLKIALFRSGQQLAWGEIFCVPEESCATFGSAFDVTISMNGTSMQVQYFSGLLLKYRTDEDGVQLSLELYDLIDKPIEGFSAISQQLVFRSAIRLPTDFSPQEEQERIIQLTEVYALHFLDTEWN